MNIPRPASADTAHAPMVQGTISRVTRLTGYLRAARPSRRKSTMRIEPTTKVDARTWIDSNNGNHQLPPMSAAIGRLSSQVHNGEKGIARALWRKQIVGVRDPPPCHRD